MTKNDIFFNFLYLLSSKKIKNKVFLEGGAALSFIYGIDRIFSNDLDFTIESKKLLKNFASTTKEIITEIAPSNRYLCDITPNKIIIKDKKK